MATLPRYFETENASTCLTNVQQVLLELGLPIIEEAAVARHKRTAKSAMLWRAVCWPVAAIVLLVAFESLGGHWLRTSVIGIAGLGLGALYTWLVSAVDLIWCTTDYATYRLSNPVPQNVAALADAVEHAGVAPELLQVEYLKHDPVLFIQEQNSSYRYDLAIW